MSEIFNLQWHQFQSNVLKSFNNIRTTKEFHDVTLVGDDHKQVTAHKIILSTASDYFRNMLLETAHPLPMLCLEGVSSKDIEHMLDYIYFGTLDIQQDKLERFLKLSHRFRLQGIGSKDFASALNPGDDGTFSRVSNHDKSNNDDESNNDEKSNNNDKSNNDDKSTKDVGQNDNFSLCGDIKNEAVALEFPQFQEENSSNITHNSRSKKRRKNKQQLEKINFNYKSIEELDQRIEKEIVRKSSNNFFCRVCKKSSSKKTNIREHVEIHFKNLSFQCDFCEVKTKTRHILRTHVYVNHKKAKN